MLKGASSREIVHESYATHMRSKFSEEHAYPAKGSRWLVAGLRCVAVERLLTPVDNPWLSG
jgi:hypothetical protein